MKRVGHVVLPLSVCLLLVSIAGPALYWGSTEAGRAATSIEVSRMEVTHHHSHHHNVNRQQDITPVIMYHRLNGLHLHPIKTYYNDWQRSSWTLLQH